ncbi:peptidase M48 [Nocardiopsis sp. CNR-923]|uniref:peptidase M48 n=1 Tax=Nocardiopsis sp. CNR-923 TaxID=1904965 RepID=UPI000A711E6A|nr:peptidase M48 [Nocardiopsis sp. CNR-923]
MPHATPPGGGARARAAHGPPYCSPTARPGVARARVDGVPPVGACEIAARAADEEPVRAPAHPWETPLLVVCVLVGALVTTALVHILWTVTGSWACAAVAAVGPPAACWTARGLRYARERAESVKISPTQFPEAYRAVVTLSAAMGLLRPPEAYVRPTRARAATDAAAHRLRRYLVLSHELFAPDGRPRDTDALAFLLAHQIGHVAAGHTSFWRRVATLGAEAVPGLGSALSRATEYTADNHAYAHHPEGAHAVRLFAGGPELYPRVNMGEMADRARTDRGGSLLLYHLLSRRPSNTRRMAALRDRKRRGRLFL